jgi:hypothetical protein
MICHSYLQLLQAMGIAHISVPLELKRMYFLAPSQPGLFASMAQVVRKYYTASCLCSELFTYDGTDRQLWTSNVWWEPSEPELYPKVYRKDGNTYEISATMLANFSRHSRPFDCPISDCERKARVQSCEDSSTELMLDPGFLSGFTTFLSHNSTATKIVRPR